MNEPLPLVLAIDDQPDNLALMEALLAPHGFRVLGCTSGPEGLAAALRDKPHLVLLDLSMPGMDGFEVLSRLRADPRTQHLPVLVLTATLKDATMVERGLALGATEYLVKPIQGEELVVRVRSALRLALAEEALERLRRDFASMLVHDMRAPLDGVRLALVLLRRQEDPTSPRWQLMDQALGGIEQLAGLADDLLLTHRLEERGFEAQCQPVALELLGQRVAQAFQALAQERGLMLSWALPSGEALAQADPQLLRRVLDNLVGNALKFTPSPGHIRLGLEAAGPEAWAMWVEDSGPGVPEADRQRIFDRYAQAGHRAQHGGAGLGLGLAFAARAVAAMGGSLSCEATQLGGARFVVRLTRSP